MRTSPRLGFDPGGDLSYIPVLYPRLLAARHGDSSGVRGAAWP